MKTRIWDIPLRLFHWTLVGVVAFSLYTGFVGGFQEMDWHMQSGYVVLALMVFRILWGIVGTRHSRFLSFIPGPRAVLDYLRNFGTSGGTWAGHNPLGALSVVVLLLLLTFQGVSGLFTNDDIMLEGPLANLVSYETSRTLTSLHKNNAWVIAGFIGLHVVAILFYTIIKKAPLIIAMLTGRMPGPKAEDEVAFSPVHELVVGVLVMGVAGGAVYAAINYL